MIPAGRPRTPGADRPSIQSRTMPFKWSVETPIKAVRMGCSYCYCPGVPHVPSSLSPLRPFESSSSSSKTNVAAVLKIELMRGVAFGEGVAVGTATDPYQPLEGQYPG